MSLAYLFDPNKQFQDLNGVNNVAGFLRVYYEGTDDRATTYKNFIGALNPADIPIDNYGRAVVIVEDEKTYRLEVYSRNGNLMWTQHPLCALVGGGGSFEQVQSNWDEEDPTSAAFIKNKPDIDNFLEKDGDGKDVTVTFNESSERTNIGTGEKLSVLFGKIKKWLSDLKAVAFSGSYNDLSDKPSIPAAQVQSDWSQTNSQAVDYIKNKPSIPAAQVNSDWNANSGVAQILNKPNLASVATSGSYNDLSGKPTIPAAQVNSDWNANSGVAQILHKPSLGSLASKNNVTSGDVARGSYNIDITGTSKYLEAISTGQSGDFDTLVPDTTRKCATYGINGTFTNGPSGSSATDYWGFLLVYRRITSVNIPYQVFVSSAGDFLTRYSTTYDSTLGKYINWTSWTKIQNVSYASKIGTASTHPAIGSTSTPVYVNNDGNVTPCSMATVASTGSYNDLSDKPTIPSAVTVDQTYNASSTNPQSGVALAEHMIRPILLSNGPTGLSHTETFSSSVPQYFGWTSDNYSIVPNATYIAYFIVQASGYKNTSVNIEIWAKKTTGKTWMGRLSVPLCRGIGYGQIILFRDNGIAFEFSVDIEPNDFSVGDEITVLPDFCVG